MESIVIPETVLSLNEYQFSGCSSLQTVKIKGNLKTIGADTFSDCASLKDIILPETLETIAEYAFYGCIEL